MVDQNTALWLFALVALVYIFWIDLRPYVRRWFRSVRGLDRGPVVDMHFQVTDCYETMLSGTVDDAPEGMRKVTVTGEEKYLRVRCVSRSGSRINDCELRVVNVHRIGPSGIAHSLDFTDTIPLKWGDPDNGEYRIKMTGDVRYYACFAKQSADEYPILLERSAPLKYAKLFAKTGRYRVQIRFSGDDVSAQQINIDFEWNEETKELLLPESMVYSINVEKSARDNLLPLSTAPKKPH